MKQQVYSIDAQGRPRWLYVDRGPGGCKVPGRGRPTHPVIVSAQGMTNAHVADGMRHMPLGQAA